MSLSEEQIEALVNRVAHQLSIKSSQPSPVKIGEGSRGCFDSIEAAIAAAEIAFLQYRKIPVQARKKIIDAIRDVALQHLHALAQLAHEETGFGRVEDKIIKNQLAITKTPGVEDLQPIAWTGDDGLTLVEGAPYGLIGSITPCTNPSETIISNTIGMIAAGNAVVFNAHPSAKRTSIFTVHLLNQAISSAGGPENLITTIREPTITSAQTLMTHEKINLLVVTGGPAVVAVAMKSGKKVIAAGPGNPPVVVDETADLNKAARDIIFSASTDNNIICIIEKNIIVTQQAAKALKEALIKHGAVFLNPHQTKQLQNLVIEEDHPNKKFIGKNVQMILQSIHMDVDESKRLALAEVSEDHPFAQIEMLMPVLPFIIAKDFNEAVDIAYRLEGQRFHTAVVHSKNIEHLHAMALRMNTAIFVKNGPALAGLGLGGEGPTSFTVASRTGEGVTTARHFVRQRRCTLSDGYFRIV